MHAILGILILVALAWALSENRKAISWRFVIIGVTVQFILAGLFLHSTWLSAALVGINQFVNAVGEASTAGTIFLFGYLGGGEFPVNSVPESPYLFAFRVLPQVIVFSVVVALLWHWRLLPAIVQGLSLSLIHI